MSHESAVETSKDIDVAWLCRLWGRYSADEMKDFIFGFLQLSPNTIDYQAASEVHFLMRVCEEKLNETREVKA